MKKTNTYLVVDIQQGGKWYAFYTNNLSEAEEVYFLRCNASEFVELLMGEPGNYETIRQSW